LNRRGVSLIEMTIVLLLLALMAGVSVAALWSLRAPPDSSGVGPLLAGRTRALVTGVPVRIARWGSDRDSSLAQVLFLPDGRAIGKGVDPIVGMVVRHAH
jgi:prepilin-type N-terminal cleavage/methylation domain-containing protein